MYRDAANRKIKEPIDYLIESSKTSRKLCIALTLSECPTLVQEANQLNIKITQTLAEKPIEEWETATHIKYRENVQPALVDSTNREE
jgi:hypothetical protein